MLALTDLVLLGFGRAGGPARDPIPGPLHGPRHGWRGNHPQPHPPSGRADRLSRLWHRREGRAGLEGLRGQPAPLQPRRHHRHVPDAPPAGRPAAQPERCASVLAGAVLQHGCQLRDEHELAELLGRGRQPSHPVGRPRGSQLHVGRRGHRCRRGPHPRPRAAWLRLDRQALGWTSRARRSMSCYLSRSSAPSCSPGRASPRHSMARRQRAPSKERSRPWRRPFASQEIIKELGTNGGGPLNANSAHPFENPTPLTNWVEMLAILIIPFGLTYTFGRWPATSARVGPSSPRWLACSSWRPSCLMAGETGGNPLLPGAIDSGLGTMEGKEVRIGSGAGGLWAAAPTGTSTGAVNAMHDKLPAPGWDGAALPHATGRGRARRSWGRAVRDARPGCE